MYITVAQRKYALGVVPVAFMRRVRPRLPRETSQPRHQGLPLRQSMAACLVITIMFGNDIFLVISIIIIDISHVITITRDICLVITIIICLVMAVITEILSCNYHYHRHRHWCGNYNFSY